MNNDYIGGYEAYDRPIERFVDKVSITKTGRIGFNKSLAAKYDLTKYQFTVLYWNKAEHSMAIEFVNQPTKQKQVKLLIDKRGFGLHLNALNFFKTYNIDLDVAQGKYEYRKESARKFGIDRDGFLLIFKLHA